jgi:hypothetical protein
VSARLAPTTYRLRARFHAPLDFAYRWCTDYTAEDPELGKEDAVRKILRKSRRTVVYEDLTERPSGWWWSHQTVTLQPPNGWHAEAVGSHRTWKIDYRLRRLPNGSTELSFRGRRYPTEFGGPNPSQSSMVHELTALWKNYGRALEKDYRTSQKGRRASR